MKPINLISLVQAKNDLSPTVFNLYLKNFEISIREGELKDVKSLIIEIKKNFKDESIFNDFFVGYTINQINKEFDLLRFGKSCIINIELKSENTGNKIVTQLLRNKYYLSFLGMEVLSFTYVSEEKKLYTLRENDCLAEASFDELTTKLNAQEIMHISDINNLFDPTNYLVSPFNSTKKFLSNQYFLTEHQQNIKNKILKHTYSTGTCFISLEGHAGTGKTLLTYDVAKELMNISKKVLILHCGFLNAGHFKLQRNDWLIAPSKDYMTYDFSKFDLIIIDEVQRSSKSDIDEIIDKINNASTKCIFSYDANQCLSSWEIKNNIPLRINEKVNPVHFKLTEKIRTNKELATFIKNFFDLSKSNPHQQYKNVNIHYFSTPQSARKFLNELSYEDWKIINLTPSNYYKYPYEEYNQPLEENAHRVIGQEFDNVVAVIDKHYYYESGKLNTKGFKKEPYYHPTKMLFQIVSRARKKLTLVIIDNEPVLQIALNMLK